MNAACRLGAILVILTAGRAAVGGERPCCEPPESKFLQRVPPVGGWFPYGGGLLRWWPRYCFPCTSTPDDYCRKSLPPVCWPPCPPYFTSGPPETCCPQGR